jgi:O-antigen/teichoic acid export membrane protein
VCIRTPRYAARVIPPPNSATGGHADQTRNAKASAKVAAKAQMGGIRASVIVLAGIIVANLGNYAFQLLTARKLGPIEYGDIAALSALTTLVGLPLGGVQFFVARHVARDTGGTGDAAGVFLRGFISSCALAGTAFTIVLLVLAPVVKQSLSILNIWAIVFTALFAIPAFVIPGVFGTAQGFQRFRVVAFALAAPSAARVVMVAITLSAGFGAGAAMGVTLCSGLLAVLIPFYALPEIFAKSLRKWQPRLTRRDLRELLPVVGGLLAITALSTDDLIVAKAVFESTEAGVYGSGSLMGRAVLYLPAAVAVVLLPKVSRRVAARQDPSGIVGKSVLVTGVFCLGVTLFYAVFGDLIVRILFGSQYEAAGGLLWMFGLAMTGYAVLNVLLTYHIGLGATRMSWLLLVGAAAQIGLFALVHDTPQMLLWASILTAALLTVAHELLVEPTLTRLLRRVIVNR